MNDTELLLLENILDSLDRLFDRDSKVVDIYTLVFASAKELAETKHFQLLDETANKLALVLKTAKTEEELREDALVETNKLRHYLAKFFPICE